MKASKDKPTPLFLVVVLLAVALCLPLLVNILFLLGAPCALFEAKFSADSLLAYFGTALVGIGTISLALLAYRQTEAIEAAKKEMTNKQDRFEQENASRPFLVLSRVSLGNDWSAFNVDEKGYSRARLLDSCSYIRIEVENVGSGPACRLRLCDDSAFGHAATVDQHRICLPCDSACIFKIPIGYLKKYAGNKAVQIKYENILGCGFEQSFEIMCKEELSPVGERVLEEFEGSLGYALDCDICKWLGVSSLSSQTRRDSNSEKPV